VTDGMAESKNMIIDIIGQPHLRRHVPEKHSMGDYTILSESPSSDVMCRTHYRTICLQNGVA